MAERRCKNCMFLDVQPDKLGRRVVRQDRTYRCAVVVPQPPLPTSILEVHSFKWPPPRQYMEGKDGEGCALHATLTAAGRGHAR